MKNIQIRKSSLDEINSLIDSSGLRCNLIAANSICYALYIYDSAGRIKVITTNINNAIKHLNTTLSIIALN